MKKGKRQTEKPSVPNDRKFDTTTTAAAAETMIRKRTLNRRGSAEPVLVEVNKSVRWVKKPDGS